MLLRYKFLSFEHKQYLQNITIASYNLIVNHDLINYFITVKYY